MNILFDIFPSHGHQHSSYKLAEILKEAGHRVIYIGEYRHFVNLPQGMSRRYINPHIFSFIENASKKRLEKIKIAFKERKDHSRYLFNCKVIEQYDQLIAELKPDLILVDHHYIQKAILYYKYHIPVISIQTAPASEMDLSIPPFCSSFIPGRSVYSKIYVFYLWGIYLIKKRFRFFFNYIIYLGEDHMSDVKRIAKLTGFPLVEYIDYYHYKGYGEFGLKNIPQLLLSPRDFDFPRPLKNNQYAIGPLLYEEPDTKIQDRRYLQVITHIIHEKEYKGINLIYCSLGTLNVFGLQDSLQIFKYIVEIAYKNPDYRIILSIGEFIDPADLLPTPDNLYVFKSLPQRHILRYCDMMIAHGGQNSITECIMNEVPLLIYPFFNGSDLGGNSARVVYHGIGSRGFIRKDSIEIMQEKIQDVLYNTTYRENIKRIKQRFEEKNNSKDAVVIIDSIVNKYHHGHTGNP